MWQFQQLSLDICPMIICNVVKFDDCVSRNCHWSATTMETRMHAKFQFVYLYVQHCAVVVHSWKCSRCRQVHVWSLCTHHKTNCWLAVLPVTLKVSVQMRFCNIYIDVVKYDDRLQIRHFVKKMLGRTSMYAPPQKNA